MTGIQTTYSPRILDRTCDFWNQCHCLYGCENGTVLCVLGVLSSLNACIRCIDTGPRKSMFRLIGLCSQNRSVVSILPRLSVTTQDHATCVLTQDGGSHVDRLEKFFASKRFRTIRQAQSHMAQFTLKASPQSNQRLLPLTNLIR